VDGYIWWPMDLYLPRRVTLLIQM